MECGGLCVTTSLAKPMLMWRVDSWAMLQPLTMDVLVPWGKAKMLTL
jgi:hypothetical protein